MCKHFCAFAKFAQFNCSNNNRKKKMKKKHCCKIYDYFIAVHVHVQVQVHIHVLAWDQRNQKCHLIRAFLEQNKMQKIYRLFVSNQFAGNSGWIMGHVSPRKPAH